MASADTTHLSREDNIESFLGLVASADTMQVASADTMHLSTADTKSLEIEGNYLNYYINKKLLLL